MKYVPFCFTIAPNYYRSFSHHLELSLFHSDFIFYSVPGPFLRSDEKLGGSREVVDLLKNNIVKSKCFVFQVQDNGAYPLEIDDPPNAIDFFIAPFFKGFVLYAELKIGVDGVNAP